MFIEVTSIDLGSLVLIPLKSIKKVYHNGSCVVISTGFSETSIIETYEQVKQQLMASVYQSLMLLHNELDEMTKHEKEKAE